MAPAFPLQTLKRGIVTQMQVYIDTVPGDGQVKVAWPLREHPHVQMVEYEAPRAWPCDSKSTAVRSANPNSGAAVVKQVSKKETQVYTDLRKRVVKATLLQFVVPPEPYLCRNPHRTLMYAYVFAIALMQYNVDVRQPIRLSPQAFRNISYKPLMEEELNPDQQSALWNTYLAKIVSPAAAGNLANYLNAGNMVFPDLARAFIHLVMVVTHFEHGDLASVVANLANLMASRLHEMLC